MPIENASISSIIASGDVQERAVAVDDREAEHPDAADERHQRLQHRVLAGVGTVGGAAMRSRSVGTGGGHSRGGRWKVWGRRCSFRGVAGRAKAPGCFDSPPAPG